MTAPTRPLHSLEAWPGESPQPPLRLLESARGRPERPCSTLHRPQPVSWLQRLRRAIALR